MSMVARSPANVTVAEPEPSPAQRRRRLAAASAFNSEAHRIVRLLEDAADAVDAFLRLHDADCACDFCQYLPDDATSIVEDMAGPEWSMRASASLISSNLPMLPKQFEQSCREIVGELDSPGLPDGAALQPDEPAIVEAKPIRFREFL